MKKAIALIAIVLVVIASIIFISTPSSSYINDNGQEINENIDNENSNSNKLWFRIKYSINQKSAKKQEKSLEYNIKSYDIVIKYLKAVIKDNAGRGYICLGIDSSEKKI